MPARGSFFVAQQNSQPPHFRSLRTSPDSCCRLVPRHKLPNPPPVPTTPTIMSTSPTLGDLCDAAPVAPVAPVAAAAAQRKRKSSADSAGSPGLAELPPHKLGRAFDTAIDLTEEKDDESDSFGLSTAAEARPEGTPHEGGEGGIYKLINN